MMGAWPPESGRSGSVNIQRLLVARTISAATRNGLGPARRQSHRAWRTDTQTFGRAYSDRPVARQLLRWCGDDRRL